MPNERLAPDLRLALGRIEPSYHQMFSRWHWPCKVWLRSGEVLERAILCPLTKDFLEVFHAMHGRNGPVGLPVSEILNLAESRHRLPACFANELYLHGETSMGATAFTVSFYSGVWRNYVAGGTCDFIDYPPLMSSAWIRSIQIGYRVAHPHRVPSSKICFFAE